MPGPRPGQLLGPPRHQGCPKQHLRSTPPKRQETCSIGKTSSMKPHYKSGLMEQGVINSKCQVKPGQLPYCCELLGISKGNVYSTPRAVVAQTQNVERPDPDQNRDIRPRYQGSYRQRALAPLFKRLLSKSNALANVRKLIAAHTSNQEFVTSTSRSHTQAVQSGSYLLHDLPLQTGLAMHQASTGEPCREQT